MKSITAIAILCLAVLCIAAGDESIAGRRVVYLEKMDLNRGGSVQLTDVTIKQASPGFVWYAFANGSEFIYSGNYEIAVKIATR